MKKHLYTRVMVSRSDQWLGPKYWKHDVTACGLKRQRDDFQIDAALTREEVTCKTCLCVMSSEPPKC